MRVIPEKSKVTYKPQAHSGLRTQEQQALLLSNKAHRVWKMWCRTNDNGEEVGVIGQDEKLDDAMRALIQQVMETDVFYSGFHIGRMEGES